MLEQFFHGRKILIASRHGKEEVIKPLLESALGVKCAVIPGINTDQFGTFSGEIERKDAPYDTVRKKCRWAMDTYGFDLAIASEGSFGSHPSAFFLPADEEWVVLIDKTLPLEVAAREISTETNFQEATLKTEEQLIAFAEAAHFPSHGLILSSASNLFCATYKGIQDWDLLRKHFRTLRDQGEDVRVQTDMRAMANPTRMNVIRQAVERLLEKMNSCCPACGFPGFEITDVERGLPCQDCEHPTHEIMAVIHACQKCNHFVKSWYPNGKQTAYPGHCDSCNP